MSDNQWSEIFNLNEELRRIEEDVDRRLEETLAEDPHVIEAETVHYGANPYDRANDFRMKQPLPTFEPVGVKAAAQEPPQNLTGQKPLEPAEELVEASVKAQEVMPEQSSGNAAASAYGTSQEGASIQMTASAEENIPLEEVTASVKENVPPEGEPLPAEEPATAKGTSPAEESAPREELVSAPAWMEGPVEDYVAPRAATGLEDLAVSQDSAWNDPAAPQEHTLQESAAAQSEASAEPQKEPEKTTNAQETCEARQQAEGRKSLHRGRTLVLLLILIGVLAGILGWWYYKEQVIPGRRYAAAAEILASGDYDAAIAAFTEIRGYKDAADRIHDAELAKASSLSEAGSYAETIEYIDMLQDPSEELLALRSGVIYQMARQYYENGDLEAAEGELLLIKDYTADGVSAADLLHEIQYQEVSDALAVYDFDTAEPILASLGDYKDAQILLEQVQNAIDIVYTDVARDDSGKEIKGQTEYLWVHSVITPGAIDAEDADEGKALRELAGATDNVDADAVRVLMMHRDTTQAQMTYTDAEPIETDKSTIITKEISSYAAIDETFGKEQTIYDPQELQRSNTDYAFAFDGSDAYAAKDAKDDVLMECKMADDGYWAKTRRVYATLKEDSFVGVPKSQLRTWTKVLSESIADEVREGFLSGIKGNVSE